MSVFFTSQTQILYIKDTISVQGWKLRPLPAYTVPRHIPWQGINLKFGMLQWPKCWQLIQIWWEHTHRVPSPPPLPPWQQNGHVAQHGLTMCTAQRARHKARLRGHMHMNGHLEDRTREGENMKTNTIWIMILHVKAWSNICICTRKTQKHRHTSLGTKWLV